MMLGKGVILAVIFSIGDGAFPEFFLDFFRYYGEDFRVTGFDCNKKESVVFSRILMANGYRNNFISVNTEHLVYPIPPYRHFFIVDLDCQNSSQLLIKANQERLFASPFRWLAYYQEKDFKNLLQTTLQNLSIYVDSDFNIADIHSNGAALISKIFKKHPREKEFLTEDFGLWNKTIGFARIENFELSVVRRRRNLGIVLNSCLVITHNDSLNHLTDKRDKHIDSMSKVNYALQLVLATVYNVTLNFSIKDTWGYQKNLLESSGMMGELTRKEADIGGTSLFIIKERIDLIDYIAMITPSLTKFVFRQPKLSYVTNVYTLPFDNNVWYSTIGLVVIMTFALFGLLKWEWDVRKRFESKNTENTVELEDTFSEVAFMTFSAFCQQGMVALPFRVPGRITTIFLLVSLMFIYVSYSANIVALLQTSSNSIRSLEDLLKSRLAMGVHDTPYNRYFFSVATGSVRKAIYATKIAPPGKPSNFMPIEEGVKKMREGLFAFHMETGPGYKIVSETFREDEKCGLQEVPFLQVQDPWLAVQKNLSCREMLKIGFQLIHENGVQQRENNLIYTRKPICTSKTSTFFSVGIVDCYPAAAILAGGIAASMAVFILEIYFYHRIKFYEKHWHQHFDRPIYDIDDVKENIISRIFQTTRQIKKNSYTPTTYVN